MASMTGAEEASVILSGPFYVVEPKWTDNELPNGTVPKPGSRTIATWEQMMHTEILNFTGGNKTRVRGAELVAWGDASGTKPRLLRHSLMRKLVLYQDRLWTNAGKALKIKRVSDRRRQRQFGLDTGGVHVGAGAKSLVAERDGEASRSRQHHGHVVQR